MAVIGTPKRSATSLGSFCIACCWQGIGVDLLHEANGLRSCDTVVGGDFVVGSGGSSEVDGCSVLSEISQMMLIVGDGGRCQSASF